VTEVCGPLIRCPRDCPNSEKSDGQCPELELGVQFLGHGPAGEQRDLLACAVVLDFTGFPGRLLWGLDALSVKKSLRRRRFF
jgi:hypothetical protein